MGKPVTVYHNGNHIEAEIHDISADGIQVRCDRKSFQAIHPSGRFIRRENAPIVDISFRLAIKGRLNDVKVRGLLYYFVVLSNAGDRDIAFGLRFISMDDITVANINAFIEAAMVPEEAADIMVMTEPESVSELSGQTDMNSYDVQTSLLSLLEKHNVVIPSSIENDRYQCLVASIETLFDKISEVESRIYHLEETHTNGH